MSDLISLKAEPRTTVGKKVKNLRRAGFIPAVVYGRGAKNQNISLGLKDFNHAYEKAGTSALIEIAVDGKEKINVLAHEPQYDPVLGKPVHVDFYQVRMDEKIKTEVPLRLVGESEAVTQLDGTLVNPRDNVEVECLPNKLVHELEVDITKLKTFDDQIKVGDLTAPDGIKILTDPEEVIALVEAPRSEEELAELEKPTAEQEAEAVEQVAGAKDEEGAEGEAETKEGEEPAKPSEESK